MKPGSMIAKRVIILLAISLALWLLLPSVAGFVLRASTSQSELVRVTTAYEHSQEGAPERELLLRWLYVRGYYHDWGDVSPTTAEKWSWLLAYCSNPASVEVAGSDL